VFHPFIAWELTLFFLLLIGQVLDMPAVLEAVTILERLPITKEALEVKFRVFLILEGILILLISLQPLSNIFYGCKRVHENDGVVKCM